MSISVNVSASTVSAAVSAGRVASVNGQTGAVSLPLGVPGAGITAIVAMTQAAYDALGTKSATTLYIVTPS
jgi:hypothetical protein